MSRDSQHSSARRPEPTHYRSTHERAATSPAPERISRQSAAPAASASASRQPATSPAPAHTSRQSVTPSDLARTSRPATAPSSSPAHTTTGTQAPINAASAAHQAARARAGEVDHLRRAAAGHEVHGHAATTGTPNRAVVGVSVLVGVVLAVLLLVVAGSAVMRVLMHDDRAQDTAVTANDGASTTPEDVVALASDNATIELNGMVYRFVITDDGASFASQYADDTGDPRTLFAVTGDPVGFAIHLGTFYVVSNADGSFYVQTYVPGDGSLPADYQQGDGTITEMIIKDGKLVLTDDTGEEHAFDLPQA